MEFLTNHWIITILAIVAIIMLIIVVVISRLGGPGAFWTQVSQWRHTRNQQHGTGGHAPNPAPAHGSNGHTHGSHGPSWKKIALVSVITILLFLYFAGGALGWGIIVKLKEHPLLMATIIIVVFSAVMAEIVHAKWPIAVGAVLLLGLFLYAKDTVTPQKKQERVSREQKIHERLISEDPSIQAALIHCLTTNEPTYADMALVGAKKFNTFVLDSGESKKLSRDAYHKNYYFHADTKTPLLEKEVEFIQGDPYPSYQKFGSFEMRNISNKKITVLVYDWDATNARAQAKLLGLL